MLIIMEYINGREGRGREVEEEEEERIIRLCRFL